MLDRDDIAYRNALEQIIRRMLWGDEQVPGLYRTLKAAPTWGDFQRSVGVIEGLEVTLREMDQLARFMNGDEQVRGQYTRAMN